MGMPEKDDDSDMDRFIRSVADWALNSNLMLQLLEGC